ncbi:MAG: Serine/threonine-protein kinase PknD [Thermoanaerobaculia bacterium]|nr:Serine/threonine-protein kinase PknD [Thermoanaerobaculia bacterium]
MTLAPGARIGSYEILGTIGAGGMGEVYRARDLKLGRDVAVKVLSSSLSVDSERLLRFEREAQFLAQLNHPNIGAIHGVEDQGGSRALILELIEGEDLFQRLARGPIPVAEAIPICRQIADALEAAHEKGIVHRDLKPANIKVTASGLVKVLDFGLAKVFSPDSPQHPRSLLDSPTLDHFGTEAGVILGTASYMSPEQARGKTVDRRSDVWAFGVVFVEMLTGKRPFDGETVSDVLASVLTREPDLDSLPADTPPAIRDLIGKCLRKDIRTRLQHMGDARVLLEELSAPRSATPTVILKPASEGPRAPGRPLHLPVAIVLSALILAGAIWLLPQRRFSAGPAPVYSQMTFRRGTIHSARFSSTGDAVLHAAGWEGRPVEIFESRRGSPESRPVLNRSASVLSVSTKGEMLVLLLSGRSFARGTLARIPLVGGAPRELAEGAEWADWAPDGEKIASIRAVPGKKRLEFPSGESLLETSGWLSHVRVSPDGQTVAFLLHPVPGDNRGSVEVFHKGQRRTLSEGWKGVWGLAFSRSGEEVWFTAALRETGRSLYAVDLSGKQRVVASLPLRMTLHDVGRDGSVLLSHDLLRRSTFGRGPGDEQERDLSWLDYSNAKDLSADGKTLLFSEDGEGGGAAYAVYIRGTDGSPAIRLGEGKATSLSPDGKWALAIRTGSDGTHQLVALPAGAGKVQEFPRGALVRQEWAVFMPSGASILIAGSEDGKPVSLWLQDFPAAGPPRPAGGEGVNSVFGALAVSPDGKWVAAPGPEEKIWLFSLEDRPARMVPGAEPREVPVQWTRDGTHLIVYQSRDLPARVSRIEVATGKREPIRQIQPADVSGVLSITRLRMTPDEKAYVYTFSRILSDLFVAEGLR